MPKYNVEASGVDYYDEDTTSLGEVTVDAEGMQSEAELKQNIVKFWEGQQHNLKYIDENIYDEGTDDSHLDRREITINTVEDPEEERRGTTDIKIGNSTIKEVRSEDYVFLPMWFKVGVNTGTIIVVDADVGEVDGDLMFYSGKWLYGDFESGDFNGGIFKGGVFSGNFNDGKFEGERFKGVWKSSSRNWISGLWGENGIYINSLYKKIKAKPSWATLESPVEQFKRNVKNLSPEERMEDFFPRESKKTDIPDFIKRAQTDMKKRFIEDLYNLKSSIADILRSDDKYLVTDIEKLQDDFHMLMAKDPAFAVLNTAAYLEDIKKMAAEDYPTTIDKYKRINNQYNEYIVGPIRKNIGLFGLQLRPEDLMNRDLGTEVLQPSTLKLTSEIPEYLKIKGIPEVTDVEKSKSWHNKLDDVKEMLKVIGGYTPTFEQMLVDMNMINHDTTQIISLEGNTQINANIADASKFYSLAGQIASRMKTAKLVAVRAENIIYGLEKLPKEFVFSPTQNREMVEILWRNYMASGKDEHIISRIRQLKDDESEIKKKFRRVYEQWAILYDDTAKQIGIKELPQIKLQLVRYGQTIISQNTIIDEMEVLVGEFEAWVEDFRDVVADVYPLYSRLVSPTVRKVAQLRQPTQPSQPQQPGPPMNPFGRLDIPQAPELKEGEVPQKPPKLPIGEEWLDLVFAEDKDLYYSRNEKLTPPQAISMAGRNTLLVAMQYQKAQGTGDPEELVVKNYVLEPYSYRMKRSKLRGVKKYFFGFDSLDNTIKCFLVGNIKGVQILPEKYSPRWEVEFH